jgi:hypothetical protein
MQTTQDAGRGKTPPYVSYPSFKTLMSELHDHGVPSRIDRSVLKRFSGVVGTQLITALRFLGFLDGQSQPTARLTELVAAYGTPEWGHKLIPILQEAYAPLFGLDLGNATASHFDETFRKSFPGSDAVLAKSANFFLGAAKDGGIILSDRVLHGRKPRTSNGSARRRAPRRKESNSSAAIPNVGAESIEVSTTGRKVSEVLLDNFDPNDMDEEQQGAVWTLLRYFKAKGQ